MNEYVFKLFITGQTARSEVAVANLRQLCARYLNGKCQVTIIDVLEQPEEAENSHVLATPMLVKVHPPPVQRIIGDLSDLDKVRANLGLSW
jgi:circadian clock protein KaiB